MKSKIVRFARILHITTSLTAPLCLSAFVAPAAFAQTYTLSTVAAFTGTENGASPVGGVTLDTSGNIFGTTNRAGASDDGVVFEIAAGSNSLTTLVSFNSTNGGGSSGSLTIDSAGNIFGTTIAGGPAGTGRVFEIPAGTNAFITVAGLSSSIRFPSNALAVDATDNIYGMAADTETNDLAIYKITAGTSTATTIATFDGINGMPPYGGLTLDSSGNLYGTAQEGGGSGGGTVFELSPNVSAAAPEPCGLALLLTFGLPAAFGLVGRRKNG